MTVTITEPKTKQEFKDYYKLRWLVLRKPWGQPRGSEKDELEDKSIHIIAKNGKGKIVGVGRGHFNSKEEAQIRFMAVDKNQRDKGVGSKILEELEKRLKEEGAKHIILNGRKKATKFYKKHGYIIIKKGHTLFKDVEHFVMRKNL